MGSVAIDRIIMTANSNSVGLIRPPAAAVRGGACVICHHDIRRVAQRVAARLTDTRRTMKTIIWSPSLYYRSEMRAAQLNHSIFSRVHVQTADIRVAKGREMFDND